MKGLSPQGVSEAPLSTSNIDANVFEADSPVVSDQSVTAIQVSDENTIEPMFANQTPPVSVSVHLLYSSMGDFPEERE